METDTPQHDSFNKEYGIAENIRLNWLVSLIFLIFVICISAVFFFLNDIRLEKSILAEIDKKLIVAADMAKESLPKNFHDTIVNKESVSEAEFTKIVKNFDRLCLAHDLEYVWSVMEIHGVIRFTSGTSQFKEKHLNHAGFFEIHSNQQAYIPVFESMKKQVTLIKDKWGSLRSVLIPAYDSHHRKYLFGACMKMDHVEKILDGHLHDSIAWAVSLSIIMSGIGLLLANRLTRRINTMTEKIRLRASGDYGLTIPASGIRELRILEDSFNIMSDTITQQIVKLEQSEAKYRLLADNITDNIWVLDLKTFTFDYLSPSVIGITGFRAEEVMELHLQDVLTPSSMKIAEIALSEELSVENQDADPSRSRTLELEQYHKNGGTVWTEVSMRFVYNDCGQPVSILGVARDISERKKAENQLRQAQKMESIGSLAGGIAHDFNNILTPIIGMSELLLEDLPQDSLEYENAKEIFVAGKRGGDLVQQILTFSRQSENEQIPVKTPQIVKEVLKLCRSTIPANIDITWNIQQDCGEIMGSPTQLHQIAMNLITNAFHAVEKTGGKISVELKEIFLDRDSLTGKDIQPGQYVMMSITDTGCGIDPAIMDKIFDPYFTTKEKGKGTGLGLAVVYGIVKEHKGEIQVYSEPGKGTTFNVYLPVRENHAETNPDEKMEKLETGDERILLVDDEAVIIRLSKQRLERLGYHVTVHNSSVDAFEDFKTKPDAYDLVITDMTMPDMTGDQLAKELLLIKPDISIIICTGFSERINKNNIENYGIKGFLMKPIVTSEMARMVREVLDQAKESIQKSLSEN